MIVGYARISTRAQGESLATQREALTAAGATRVYEDTISGARSARPGLDMALDHGLRDGDVLMVTRLDRLGRSTVDTLRTVQHLDAAGVTLRALDLDLDTSSPSGRLVVSVLASLAQWERETMLARTREGRARARPGPLRRPSPRAEPAPGAGSARGTGLGHESARRGHVARRQPAHDPARPTGHLPPWLSSTRARLPASGPTSCRDRTSTHAGCGPEPSVTTAMAASGWLTRTPLTVSAPSGRTAGHSHMRSEVGKASTGCKPVIGSVMCRCASEPPPTPIRTSSPAHTRRTWPTVPRAAAIHRPVSPAGGSLAAPSAPHSRARYATRSEIAAGNPASSETYCSGSTPTLRRSSEPGASSSLDAASP